jgi:hypothetical protein
VTLVAAGAVGWPHLLLMCANAEGTHEPRSQPACLTVVAPPGSGFKIVFANADRSMATERPREGL